MVLTLCFRLSTWAHPPLSEVSMFFLVQGIPGNRHHFRLCWVHCCCHHIRGVGPQQRTVVISGQVQHADLPGDSAWGKWG